MNSKKLGKVSELAQILMAIDNIESKCRSRETTAKLTVRHNVPEDERPKNNFDDMVQSVKFAKLQLGAVKNYMFDFKEIYKNVQSHENKQEIQKGDKEISAYLTHLKDNQELI